jgi:hypothetical protein
MAVWEFGQAIPKRNMFLDEFASFLGYIYGFLSHLEDFISPDKALQLIYFCS